jgi:hypothetical protein
MSPTPLQAYSRLCPAKPASNGRAFNRIDF